MEPIRVAVPRKGRPLEAVLERVARSGWEEQADEIISTLRYEKAITKDKKAAESDVYSRLERYSDLAKPTAPEYTLMRDDRAGMPRRVVFDSVTVPLGDRRVQLVGREEPLRSLRKHEFALGFDSADLVLEEIVSLGEEPLTGLDAVNERISPTDTDVRVVTGLGDTVYHTLMARPEVLASDQSLDRTFVGGYSGELCISPRYERLVEAVLGTRNTGSVEFTYPENGQEEEEAIAETGLGVYITVTGSTAREYGLVVGEKLFPSETVLLSNVSETDERSEKVVDELLAETRGETEIPTPNS
ncbi:hypothetical protein [Halobacteriaceae bacterium SHR40]|uniref:hypothetical protein n=1 Tax=Halovenus amylolytica TaxID=2500550 RepID=UPI000FE2E258